MKKLINSVPDPDPHVIGPPGPGSTSQRYGSGSGSFYHHAKIVRKNNLDSYYFVTLCDFLSLKNYVNVPSKAWIRGSGSGSTPKLHGFATLDLTDDISRKFLLRCRISEF
jgi:hypothetical protein